jgi:hypothetical protein
MVRIRATPSAGATATVETTVKVLGSLPDMVRVLSTGWQDARLEYLAGHESLAGHATGRRDEARFRDLGGVIPVFFNPNPAVNGRWLVADRGNDTIWVVDPERGGWAWPWLGAPSAPGTPRACKDGKGTEARLQGPSFLAIRPGAGSNGQPWECYISDTLNQVIRVVDEDGLVRTFAGRPGVAGHHDDVLGQALFGMPKGLAVAADGTLYVAEGYNNTVRRIHRGRVTTLAGHPAQPLAGETKGSAPSPIRWGPIRNGRDLSEAPPETRAALRKPFHVAFDGLGSCVVAMGTCLGDLVLQSRERSREVLPESPSRSAWEEPESGSVFRGRSRTVYQMPGADDPESKAPAAGDKY